MAPDDIRRLREREEVPQAVFASYLNVTTNLVGTWERGEKRPHSTAVEPCGRKLQDAEAGSQPGACA